MEHSYIIDCLDKTPFILKNLLNQIPHNLYKVRRVKNKWSIHEQICHLVEAQSILKERFILFEKEINPLIKSYQPPINRATDHYQSLDMVQELKKFFSIRAEMVIQLKAYDTDYWQLKGRHEGFEPYSTIILLTHALNVDYAHLFTIEQLGLTKPEFENEIITIP